MADVIVRDSPIHGTGVFATRDFAAGEIILPIDDSRVVDDEHPLRPDCGEHQDHCDYLAGDLVVLMRAPEVFINSSCDPNTSVKTIDGTRFVIARRSLRAGEELTYDYIINFHGGIVWDCACGSPRCRGFVAASFFDLPLAVQLDYLPLLDEWFIAEHRSKVKALRRRAGKSSRSGKENCTSGSA
jgi:hypothetical protein